MLALDEQTKLVNFLNQGKALYIEGCDFAAHNNGTELFQKFGCNFVSDGNPYQVGNLSTVSGQTGTITEGTSYTYLFQHEPDSYVDAISANGGTLIFQCQNNNGRAVNYSGSVNNYRSIYSTFMLGALRDSTNTKSELMAIYMNYLSGRSR